MEGRIEHIHIGHTFLLHDIIDVVAFYSNASKTLQLQTFLAALKALTGREVQYGSYATAEEVKRSCNNYLYGVWNIFLQLFGV